MGIMDYGFGVIVNYIVFRRIINIIRIWEWGRSNLELWVIMS